MPLISYLSCFILLVGFLFSKFLLTVGMIGILVGACWNLPTFKALTKATTWAGLVQNKAYLSSIGIFLITLLSGIYTTDWGEFATRIRVALPFLVLPIGFGLQPNITEKQYKGILYIFVYTVLVAALGVGIYYFSNQEFLQFQLSRSGVIPTPNKDHVRFSLLVCLAAFAGLWLWRERFMWRYAWERNALLGAALGLVVMLHLLAVRSGMLAFYVGILAWCVQWIVLERRWILGLSGLVLILATPFAAYYTLPSVRQKIGLTMWNIQQYQEGKIGEYSDTQRLLSYSVAWQVIQKHCWWGVGMGNLKQELEQIYQRDYPQQKPMFPHNQFLTYWAGAGLVGMLAFLICFFVPLCCYGNHREPFFVAFYAAIFSSFLTENTLLIAIGVAIHTFFLMLGVSYKLEKKT